MERLETILIYLIIELKTGNILGSYLDKGLAINSLTLGSFIYPVETNVVSDSYFITDFKGRINKEIDEN